MRATLPLLAGVVAGSILTGALGASDSDCADCHRANPDLPSYAHIADWADSIHGRERVGCESCHGGDPNTFQQFLAHRDILHPEDPDSPLHPTRLASTCGVCHGAILSAFEDSSHGRLIRQGDVQVPGCISCHGPVAAQGLGPNGLQVACSRCHDADARWPEPEVSIGGAALAVYREAERQLKKVRNRVRKVKEGALAHELEAGVIDVAATLDEAIEAGHAMDLDTMLEESRAAQATLDGLFEALKQRRRR
ncbi:MAG: cytochrome c3 family protein [Thermoanaerobaculia bacterium]|nr:cytochrome c3 family protein [Thermoanaerobaculia bacterium]